MIAIETTCKTCGETFIHGGVFPISECEQCQTKKPPKVYKHSNAEEKPVCKAYVKKPRTHVIKA